jgi:multidrug resistance efflux pump
MNQRKRRKESDMTEIANSIPDAGQEDYARGMALLINVRHERDQAITECAALEKTCADLRSQVAARDAQIESLKSMMRFAEDQARLREAESANRVLSFQNDRDKAVTELAEADAALNCIANVVLAQVRERGHTLAAKVNGEGSPTSATN